MYVQIGTHDILLSDSDLIVERARAAGVDVTYSRFDGMWQRLSARRRSAPRGDEAMADLADAFSDFWAGRPLVAESAQSSARAG